MFLVFCINPLTRKKRSPVVSAKGETLGRTGKGLAKREKRETVETEHEISLRSYGSVLRYQCGLARRFYDPDLDLEYDERNMTCNWNKTWTTRDYIDECVWVSCLYPPEPPAGTFLSMLWSGDPVDFYGNVSYVCEEEGLYFEWDRDMLEFNISCMPGGIWDQPTTWPICVPCEFISTVGTRLMWLYA